MARKVIHIPGKWHGGQPIPAATKTGPLVTSGGVRGMDPETNEVVADLPEQARWAFEHVRRIMAEAGGTTDDIAHMNVYVNSHLDSSEHERFPLVASAIQMSDGRSCEFT